MVQSIDNSANRPIYNGVKINIQKPEVNASGVNSKKVKRLAENLQCCKY